MIVTIEKEVIINTGRFQQTHTMRVECEIIDGRSWIRPGDVMRRRYLGDKWFDGRELWEMLSYGQREEILHECEMEYHRANGLVLKAVS